MDTARKIVEGYWTSQQVRVLLRLGIPELLPVSGGGEPGLSAEEIAETLKIDPDNTYRLLRGLTVSELFTEDPQHRFKLTPVGAAMRRDHPRSWRSWLEIELDGPHASLYEHLEHFVREGGGDAFTPVFGTDGLTYAAEHPEYRAWFDEAMGSLAKNETPAVVENLNLETFKCIVDVGGGNGELLALLADAVDPSARLICQDLAEPGAEAKSERIEFVAMNMLESIVPDADCYLLKHIFEGFDDEQSLTVLRNVHSAARDNATVAIIESVIAPPDVPNFGKMLDVHMILYGAGRSRTEADVTAMLRDTGFDVVKATPSEHGVYVIESRKA